VPDHYLRALIMDARAEARTWSGHWFGSVYIGGGTPSLLDPPQMEQVMSALGLHYAIGGDAEITVECNPNTVDEERLAAFKRLGITRLSVGVQSMSASELKMLARRHSAEEARAALETARSVGFETVSADIIVGIPGQGRVSLTRTVSEIAELVDHVSAYMLSVESGTELERIVAGGAIEMPGDSEMIALYELAGELLAAEDFHRYETSNWCRPGHECVHNNLYWARGGYLGLGAGSHSHIDGVRSSKIANPDRYAGCVLAGGDAVDMRERLGSAEMLTEEIMLGLRTARGLDLRGLVEEYGADPASLRRITEDLRQEGYAVSNGNYVLLSSRGFAVQDAIALEIASCAFPAERVSFCGLA
jgi:oxygen-independent coproporphyrinogen-3 oxidase